MGLLDLTETNLGISQSHVREVVLDGRTDVLAALYVVSLSFFDYKRVLQKANPATHRGGTHALSLYSFERVSYPRRVCQGPYAGGKHAEKVGKLRVVAYRVALDQVPDIRLTVERLQCAHLLLVRTLEHHQGDAAKLYVLRPAIRLLAIIRRHELRETEWPHTDLVAAPTELSDDVPR